MPANLGSPLSQLVTHAVVAVTSRLGSIGIPIRPEPVGDVVDQLTSGLIEAVGLREIAADLDVESVSLLTAASIVGLKVLDLAEPGVYHLQDALDTLEDLLRRTAEGETR